jgi:hypothetical protein
MVITSIPETYEDFRKLEVREPTRGDMVMTQLNLAGREKAHAFRTTTKTRSKQK